MGAARYFKKMKDDNLLFLRVTESKGEENVLIQDLQVVKMDDHTRFMYGTKHMDEINLDEFRDLVNKYKLGEFIEQPLADEPPKNQHNL